MRLARLTGLAILLMTSAHVVAGINSDPGMESDDDRQEYIQEAVDAVARMPGITVAQTVQISLVALAAVAAVGMYRLTRQSASGSSMIGAVMLVLWGVVSAVGGMVGAAMVSTAETYVGGSFVEVGDDQTLELIKTLGVIHFAAWLAGSALLGLALAILASALSRAAVLPRWPAWIGVAGVPSWQWFRWRCSTRFSSSCGRWVPCLFSGGWCSLAYGSWLGLAASTYGQRRTYAVLSDELPAQADVEALIRRALIGQAAGPSHHGRS